MDGDRRTPFDDPKGRTMLEVNARKPSDAPPGSGVRSRARPVGAAVAVPACVSRNDLFTASAVRRRTKRAGFA
jgi:hypothetical protein